MLDTSATLVWAGSESSSAFNENAISDLFRSIAKMFSFESDFLRDVEYDDDDEETEDKDDGDNEDVEDEDDDNNKDMEDIPFLNALYPDFSEVFYVPDPLPDHVANHDFAQYTDGDWFAGELDIVETQTDVLRGPASTTVDHVAMPIGITPEPCVLCDEHTPMRQLAACNHIVCEECLDGQLKVENECRYKCPFCRAEFFPDVPEDDHI